MLFGEVWCLVLWSAVLCDLPLCVVLCGGEVLWSHEVRCGVLRCHGMWSCVMWCGVMCWGVLWSADVRHLLWCVAL